MEAVELTLVDEANGNAPIPDARLDVYNSAGSAFLTSQRTDSLGSARMSLNPGTYVVRVFQPGTSSPDQTIEVQDTSGTALQEFTLVAESVSVSPPSSPQLCRLYADFLTLDGMPLRNFKVNVYNLHDPEAYEGLAVMEKERQYISDSSGHMEFDVVRGTRVRVAFVTSPLTREFTVPDKPIESLLAAVGSATDVFRIVKR